MDRIHIFYSGTVQGVGFRYTVHSIATGLAVMGWVRNLPDGRVEMLAEGPREKLEKLCSSIEGHFEGYIRHKDEQWYGAQGQINGFEIRR